MPRLKFNPNLHVEASNNNILELLVAIYQSFFSLPSLSTLSYHRAMTVQASLRICGDSPDPLLLAYIKYGYRRRLRPSPAG